MLRRLKLLMVLLTLSLVITGCSRVGLAYRNLDVIIPWTLNDYLDMNAGQKSWFNDNYVFGFNSGTDMASYKALQASRATIASESEQIDKAASARMKAGQEKVQALLS